ncbi:hypothetical protein [Pandoraea communis]|uniref:hypothetical protein n=1 Tax=Pandoraea communis TaxID=2508297 RepID=UPI0025A68A7D|nr:hypothetical protein [Pandoraea communis]MDM8359015.1 hypothetical protein [Pandoraea communis]
MKFKKGIWRDVEQQPPYHNGAYDVRLRSGLKDHIVFRAGTWARASSEIVEWRGLELKGISQSQAQRKAMDAYRAASRETHGVAMEAALFLARRGVSLNFRSDAYHFYLVANAIDRGRLKEVDKEWIERYATRYPTTVASEQLKADAFFEKRGGRPQTS